MPALIIYQPAGTSARSMLIYLAALQGVPESLHEAAMIDGAGVWHRFRHITVPMITPAIFFNIVLGIIGSFQVLHRRAASSPTAGPANATLFYMLYLYRSAFRDGFKMGYASALAWFLFLIILAFTLLQLVLSGAGSTTRARRRPAAARGGGVRPLATSAPIGAGHA